MRPGHPEGSMRTSLKPARALYVAIIPLVLLAAGCRLVGSGTLEQIPSVNAREAREGPGVSVNVYRADPGDAWPPAGKLAIWLRATDFPTINCGVQCTYLELRNPPIEYRSCDELINERAPLIPQDQEGLELIGRVDIDNEHAINEVLLIDDIPENRSATWVLTDSGIGSYIPIRCGKVSITSP
jgi:hypothetical protein